MRSWDYVVIGAGVIGLNVAQQLSAKCANAKILILDRDQAGFGVSQYSVGLHFPYGSTQEKRELSAAAHIEHQRRLSDPFVKNMRRVPFVGIVHRKNLKEVCTKFHVHVKAERNLVCSSQSLRTQFRSDQHEAIVVDECHYADVGAMCKELRSALIAKIDIWEGTRVTDITISNREVFLKLGCGGLICARQVVVAVGPWIVEEPFSKIAQEAAIRVKKVIALHISVAPVENDKVIFLLDEDAFLLPHHDAGHWIFSYKSTQWDVLPSDSLFLTPEDRIEALQVLERFFPELVPFCNGSRVFCDAYSHQFSPTVKRFRDSPMVISVAAGSGSGYRLAPAIAAQAVDLLLEGS